MSAAQPMGSARRRAIPGMAVQTGSRDEDDVRPSAPVGDLHHGPGRTERRAADYSATRLVNFRLPVDLHDRFKVLVREAEQRHPRLRRASLTELLIALLEEAPQTADEVAELIRRKRLAEHQER